MCYDFFAPIILLAESSERSGLPCLPITNTTTKKMIFTTLQKT
jgi:hypothetical protein